MTSSPRFAVFGTPELAVVILEELKRKGLVPALVVTTPDKPVGRKMVVTPPPTKAWAMANSISVAQPEKITSEFMDELGESSWDLFVVAAYGKILPARLLEIPKHGVLNVHPSLLPRLRGASPIRSAILEDEKETGVTIMLMDEEVDHGPILAQEKVSLPSWPPYALELEEILAHKGAELLTEVIPQWLGGDVTARAQEHGKATFTKKITKEDALIELTGDPYKNLLKIRAYEGSPGAYFFTEKNGARIRVKIIRAELKDGKLDITKVIPEGKREMSYADFVRQL